MPPMAFSGRIYPRIVKDKEDTPVGEKTKAEKEPFDKAKRRSHEGLNGKEE